MEKVLVDYVWIDGYLELRSKTRILHKQISSVNDLPWWRFDGSSTGQTKDNRSDLLLKPVSLFRDPFKSDPHKIVLCEVYYDYDTPHESNTRVTCNKIMKEASEHEPMFGIEQEYILFDRNDLPHGWKTKHDPGIGKQGPYYCGVGGDRSFGRDIVEKHLQSCLYAGVMIEGINGEVMPSQWEYQIGICKGVQVGDHLWIARYLLNRIAEQNNICVSLHPKPLTNWNGSGAHTNFSTKETRAEGGLTVILEAVEKLNKKHDEHIKVYGLDNDKRLTGKHETAAINKFTSGVSDRDASVRIPLPVFLDKKGYLEDRRPASNMDPYIVTAKIVRTICLED
jgi:glutamine synthetase